MAAYAAVNSLKHTLWCLLHSSHYSIPSTSQNTINFASEEVDSVKEVLELLDSGIRTEEGTVKAWNAFESHLSDEFPLEFQIVQFAHKNISPLNDFIINNGRVDGSDGRIREAVHKLEDALESMVSKLKEPLAPLAELEAVKEEIDSFTQTVNNRRESISSGLPEEKEHAVSDTFHEIKRLLTEIDIFAYEVRIKLDAVLLRLDTNRSNGSNRRLNALRGKMREAASEFEDMLESYVSNQFLTQSESHLSSLLLDLQELHQEIDSFTQSLKKLKEEYFDELVNLLPEDDDNDGDAISLRNCFGGEKSDMVGLLDIADKIREELTDGKLSLEFVTLFGMAGIGKTTVVKKVCEDPLVLERFDCRAWVTIGPKYQLKNIAQHILAQVNPFITDKILAEGDEKLKEHFNVSLAGKRYLVILDDVWNTEVLDYFKRLFPDDNSGSRVLLTSRIQKVAGMSKKHKMCLLNKEESQDLLFKKIFGERQWPHQLEKVGKKIAEKCDGLPLTIVTVAHLLSKNEKTPGYWERVADEQNSIFKDAYDQMTEVLLPSYTYLPQHLKACVLYLGVFPEKYMITRSTLNKLWNAEKFLHRDMASADLSKLLVGLVDCSVLMDHQESTIDGGIKTCRLHSSFWQFCKREAEKEKFSYVISSDANCLVEGIKSQRRLCIHKNSLLARKDIYYSIASFSTAHSFICTGPYHQYPVPLCLDLKLLRVLNALTIRLYDFPLKVLELFHLKYLALTCDGEIPPSISKLWNLEVLIVLQHLCISHSQAESYLPVDIWDMKKLKHIQITRYDLRETCDDAFLEYLVSLSDVSIASCTKSVLKKLPNLKKLRVRIELAPGADESLSCFDHISHLDQLESLTCVVVNPNPMYVVVKTLGSNIVFPQLLKKLCLSGFGYPWEDTRLFSPLPNLEVLKLRHYAFRGPEWETEENGFSKLRILIIEDTDLVRWSVGHESFPRLSRISLKYCFKLEEIPQELANSLSDIELVDCNHSAVASAKNIKEECHHSINVSVQYSE